MSARLRFFVPLLGLCLCVVGIAQQTPAACGAAPAIMRSTQPNIFSEQQEQWLGEAMADQMDRFSAPIKNPALNAYLATIGDRLLAGLPPTDLHFTYTLVESPEVNGFSLAGGRVYLTRKLVASAHSEDEIASVIGHEMGHILTHQFAIETTADMKRLLGITSVSDRADVYKKFQMLVDARMKDKHPTDPETDEAQDQADRVAVYAVAAAGYRTAAYAEFWDRSFFVGGKTGSGLGDFFHITSPSQKRLRRIRGIIGELPAGCGNAKEVAANPAFQAWQREVLENQAAVAGKSGAKDDGIQLAPIRMDVDRLRFSRDGKYILAQDEGSIFVLSRDPFKELFRFDAENALPAEFTPDSQAIVFSTPALHVEIRNIAQQKLISAHDVVTKQGCIQSLLSPDGRTMACVTGREPDIADLSLLDVATGNVLFEERHWFTVDSSFLSELYARRAAGDRTDVVPSSFSSDGNVLFIGGTWIARAFDLRTRAPIKLGGFFATTEFGSTYCFRGNDKIVAVNALSTDDSGLFSFPDGKRLSKFKLPFAYLHASTGGDYVITPGPKDFEVGLGDAAAGKFVVASHLPGIDSFGNYVVAENVDGTLALMTLGPNGVVMSGKASLSSSPISRSRTISLSPDGRYLAFSAHTRSTIWDVETGKQVFLAHGFNGAYWTPEGKLLGEFPKRADAPHAVRRLTIAPPKAEDFTYKLPDRAHLEIGHLFEWKLEKNTYTFTVSSPTTGTVEWMRSFVGSRPDYTLNLADRNVILDYWLESTAGKEKVKADAALKARAGEIKDKSLGRLIEMVNSADGKMLAQTIVEIPRSSSNVDGFDKVGDLLYLSTGDNRTIVYTFETGAQVRQLFGSIVAADGASGSVCTVNRRDEVTVIDKEGKELAHLKLTSPLRYAVLRGGGTQLFVFTADQRIHRFKVGA